jgi:hypothetical protein
MRAWCISDGNLWLMDGESPPVLHESPFAREHVARAERGQAKNAWRHAPGDDGGGGGMIPRSMLWGGRQASGPAAPPKFRYATRGPENDSLYYVLEMSASSGLFQYKPSEKRETRIFHAAKFRCLGLAYDHDRDGFIIAADNPDGSAHLTVYDKSGNFKGSITGGDTVDAAPSCSPVRRNTVLYQSAGVARHPQQNYAMALGPSAIHRLDYVNGKLDTLLEHKDYDYLQPREDRQGNLYYIRRPFERSGMEEAGSWIKDLVMFPWRIVKMVFGYLDFWSAVYGKERLRNAGVPKHLSNQFGEKDVAAMWLHGRMIDLNQVRIEDDRAKGGLVPASWQLRRLSPDGQDVFVADHVVSYDLADDGGVVYTNGFTAFRILKGDPQRRRHEGLIESISAA